MSKKSSMPLKTRKIVVSFDISSSTGILEDLLRTENEKVWYRLLRWLANYLSENEKHYEYKIYKFTGDGWILMFNLDCSGEDIIDFLVMMSVDFNKRMKSLSDRYLETPPKVSGLTFGIAVGTLLRFQMRNKTEFIGRAINMACRLQSACNPHVDGSQYLLLATRDCFNRIKEDYPTIEYDYPVQNATRKLKNIAGNRPLQCKRIELLDDE